ncbi:hypothetical protein BH09MYX1_BH09MYX1_25320 [soil metagenome]
MAARPSFSDFALALALENESARNVTPLASLFENERDAIASYGLLLDHRLIGDMADVVRHQKAVHADRAMSLFSRMREVGIQDSTEGTPWRALSLAIDQHALPASLWVLAVLVSEEERILVDYRGALKVSDTVLRRLIAQRLLPGQVSSHNRIHQVARDAPPWKEF